MKILIGYDGSVDADGALHDLETAAVPKAASAVVMTLATPWVPFGADGQIPLGFSTQFEAFRKDALKEARVQAEKAAAYLRRRFPGWTVKAEAGIGQPAQALLDKAEKWKPDLIVLGSHGHTALGRLLMGSVSHTVLNHASCTVRITRPRLRPRKGPLRLLIGVDGGPDSDSAVARAAARPWPRGTEARALGVLEFRLNPGVLLEGMESGFQAELEEARLATLEGKVAEASQKLAAAGLKAAPSVHRGDPRSTLIEEARSWGADCLIVGARGAGPIERFFLGSVSSTIASQAGCTVEVVRRARKPASAKAGNAGRRMSGAGKAAAGR